MKMTVSEIFVAAAVVAAVSLFPSSVLAQEEGDDADGAAAVAAALGLDKAPEQREEKHFYSLPRCQKILSGTVKVLKPNTKDWQPLEEGRFYPFGSVVRVEAELVGKVRVKPRVEFSFGPAVSMKVTNDVEFAVREAPMGDKKRTVVLRSGDFFFSLPLGFPPGLFSVATEHVTCSDLAGNSVFSRRPCDDGDELTLKVVTGLMALEGRHFKSARVEPADQVAIRTTQDGLFSSLRGITGSLALMLDQGTIREHDFETGEDHERDKTLDFVLSPGCAVKVFRRKAAVGGRMVVSTMTFNTKGDMVNRCVFAEKRFNVNTGELVINPKDLPVAQGESAAAAAESAGDVEAVAVDVSEEETESAGEDGASDAAAETPAEEEDFGF